jgi:hypothetical protein
MDVHFPFWVCAAWYAGYGGYVRLAFMRKDGAGLMRMASYGGGLKKSWMARDVGGFGEAFRKSQGVL